MAKIYIDFIIDLSPIYKNKKNLSSPNINKTWEAHEKSV